MDIRWHLMGGRGRRIQFDYLLEEPPPVDIAARYRPDDSVFIVPLKRTEVERLLPEPLSAPRGYSWELEKVRVVPSCRWQVEVWGRDFSLLVEIPVDESTVEQLERGMRSLGLPLQWRLAGRLPLDSAVVEDVLGYRLRRRDLYFDLSGRSAVSPAD